MDLKLSLSNNHLKLKLIIRIRDLGHIIQTKTPIIDPNYLNLHLDINIVRKPKLKKIYLVQGLIELVVYLVRQKLTKMNLELIKNSNTHIKIIRVRAIKKISLMKHFNQLQCVNSDLRIAQMLWATTKNAPQVQDYKIILANCLRNMHPSNSGIRLWTSTRLLFLGLGVTKIPT